MSDVLAVSWPVAPGHEVGRGRISRALFQEQPADTWSLEWYDIKAPGFFENTNVGKTLVNRTQGMSEFLYDPKGLLISC